VASPVKAVERTIAARAVERRDMGNSCTSGTGGTKVA
jgi:hypothetical protein